MLLLIRILNAGLTSSSTDVVHAVTLKNCRSNISVCFPIYFQDDVALHSDKDVKFDSEPGSDTNNSQEKSNASPSKGSARTPTTAKER